MRDINAQPTGVPSSPQELTTIGTTTFFRASTPAQGAELWKTDGTPAGTVLVKDINAGAAGSSPSTLTEVNGVLFFWANDGISGIELWKSDGTTVGTVLVKDITAGSGSTLGGEMAGVGGTLYFARPPTIIVPSSPAAGALWKSDGTEAGTTAVASIGPHELTDLGGTLVFAGDVRHLVSVNPVTYVTETELWKSDGTPAGTARIRDINPGNGSASPAALTELGGNLYFGASDGGDRELWRSDGTEAGTQRVLNINPAGSSGPTFLVRSGGRLFFSATDGVSGRELWISDGTAAGTGLLRNISPGAADSTPQSLMDAGGTLFFTAETPSQGRELWESNGTPAGTVLVEDINPGLGASSPSALASLGGTLFFAADDGLHGTELWRSDGTMGGTSLVRDIFPGASGSSPASLAGLGGRLLLSADDGTIGRELWVSDGTEATTTPVKNIAPEPAGVTRDSAPLELTAVGGTLYFSASEGTPTGTELWKSDGTPAGTALVADIRPGGFDSNPIELTGMGGRLFFQADDGAAGRELWISDGTPGGTFRVKDVWPGPGSSMALESRSGLTVAGGTLFFAADDGVRGGELWKSDGTEAGTVLVKDLNPGAAGSSPQELTEVGGILYFSADDGVSGRELWRSDGTQAGTSMVKDIRLFAASSSPAQLTRAGGSLFFVANDGLSGSELWTSDGTPAGTRIVADIVPGAGTSSPSELTSVNGALFFSANDGAHGYEVWKSDGTAAGTALVADIMSGSGSSAPSQLTDVNGTLFFVAFIPVSGLGVWKSDGTEGGTVLVKEPTPGAAITIVELTGIGGALYFSAFDDSTDNGRELWKSDGTPAGTTQITDINPGPGDSSPAAMTLLCGRVLFSAEDGLRGREPWAIATMTDADGDSFSPVADPACPSAELADCDDANPAIYPGAPQFCDGINNDCRDPAWPVMPPNEADADQDGVRICSGDCDDTNPARFPAHAEDCDGIDNNCDGIVPSVESDADGDGLLSCRDNCPAVANAVQLDSDLDGVGDACDTCPFLSNAGQQADQDGDAVGDVCDVCAAVPNPQQEGPVRLNAPLPAFGDVASLFLVSPDSTFVVYTADLEADGVMNLYLSPVGGGASRKLNGPLVAGGRIGEFVISPDSSRVLYVADQDTLLVTELYSVPALGGDPVKLNKPLPSGGSVRAVPDFAAFTANGASVIYLADQDVAGVVELYAVPAGGGTSVKLNGALAAGGDVTRFLLAPDGSRVIYLADQQLDQTFELYSAPVQGGSFTKLNPPLNPGAEILDFKVSPIGSLVVLRGDLTTDGVTEIFRVPAAGGPAVKLNGSLVAGGNVGFVYGFAPDGSRVVYVADQQTNDVFELFSVSVTGGAPVKLNGPLVAGGDVVETGPLVQIAPDSSRVVYAADQSIDGAREIFSVPTGGGTAVKLNTPIGPAREVLNFAVSRDSSRVVYRADTTVDNVHDLYTVPIGGGSPVKLNGPLTSGGEVFTYALSADSAKVAYLANEGGGTRYDLISVPTAGGGRARLTNNLERFAPFTIASDSSRVVFTDDRGAPSVVEIYGVPLQTDSDGDGARDFCDVCPAIHDAGQDDRDADAVGDACDNCTLAFNPDQGDADQDGVGNACDSTPCPARRVVMAFKDGSVRSINLNGSGGSILATVPPYPYGVALDTNGSIGYATGFLDGSLAVFHLDGSPPSTGLTGLSGPTGIAALPFSHLVVSESASGRLRHIRLPGTDRTLVSGLSQPQGVDFSPWDAMRLDGLLAVAENGSGELTLGELLSVDSAPQLLITDSFPGLSGPKGVALKDDATAAYVTEEPAGRLTKVDFGSRSFTTVASGLESPLGVALNAAETLAFVVEAPGALAMVDLETGKKRRVGEGLAEPSFGVAIEDAVCSFCDDADGDGFGSQGDLCPGGVMPDCNDSEARTYPGASEVNDGRDNQCPEDPGTGLVDELGGTSAFQTAGDNPQFCWTAQVGATSYQTLRSTAPDFSIDCVISTTAETCFTDPENPPPGTSSYYLVRPLTPFPGSWGAGSDGVERIPACANP